MSELGEFVSLNWMKRSHGLRRENFRLFLDDSKTMASSPIRLRKIAKSGSASLENPNWNHTFEQWD